MEECAELGGWVRSRLRGLLDINQHCYGRGSSLRRSGRA